MVHSLDWLIFIREYPFFAQTALAVDVLGVISRFLHERLFVDALEVVGGRLVSILAIIGEANSAATYPPDHSLGLDLGGGYLFAHQLDASGQG